MAIKKKRKKYPGPWREVSREFTGKYEVYTTQHRPFNVNAIYVVRYRRKTGPNCYIEERSESKGPNLNHILRELSIDDRSYALISLASGAFEIIEKLFGQYQWKIQKEAIAEAEKRSKARKSKKRSTELEQRLLNKKFTRVVEV